MSEAIPKDVPFTLSCTDCDADSPDSYEEAIRDGWSDITYYPDGLSENFLGFCPDCRRQEEQIRAKLREVFESQETEGGDA